MYTPEQLKGIAFGKKFGGGYNVEDVDSVFSQLCEDYENLYDENISIKTKMRVIVAKLEEYRNAEESMKQAVIDTQKTCEQMIADTKAQCAGMIRDAEAAAIEADAKISLEESRVESARQVAARQIGEIQSQLENCIQLLKHIQETNKPMNPVSAAPAAPAASTMPAAPQKAEQPHTEPVKPVIPNVMQDLDTGSESDLFNNLQFGRNYGNSKKR